MVPEETNAVQIMTIHKAKGLAFNVVMIPFNWEDTSNKNEIWVDTSRHFQKLKSALISSSKQLEFSHFSDEYKKEKELSLLDNLNKLYVAMTRPKERLYIFSKSFPNKIADDFDRKGKLHSFLHNFSNSYPVIVGNSDEKFQEQKNDQYHPFSVKKQEKTDWRNVISLKHSAEKVWDVEKQKESIKWGKILHLALSQIKQKEDIEVVIDTLFSKGKCDKSQYDKLKNKLPVLLESEKIAKYFTPNWEVRTEKEILLETGETYIPDRLVFNGNEVTIIDYKTGDREHKHQNQIKDYANALKKMGYEVIDTDLIYTQDILQQ